MADRLPQPEPSTLRGPATDPHESGVLDAIEDLPPIHVRIPGTGSSYCGAELDLPGGYVPTAEVTDSAWCARCVEIQDNQEVIAP